MKRRLILPILLIFCLLAMSVTAFAQDGAIEHMRTDCVVNADGTARITQTLSLRLNTLVNELRFPLAENVTRAELAGYRTSRSVEDGITVLTLKSDTGITGSRTFTVEYTVDKLVSEEEGVQKLRLPMLCAKWEYPMERYDFSIQMPAAFASDVHFESGYLADVIEDYLTWTVDDARISGSSLQAFRDHEALTMLLDVEEDYFSGSYSTWSAGWLTTAFLIVFSLLALVYWAVKLRSKRIRPAARMLPPDSANAGDLPFLLCAGKANFSTLVLQWASLGYLTVQVSAQGDVSLHKRLEMGSERRRSECKLFAELFLEGDVCDGASLRYKRTAQMAMKILPRAWMRRLYLRESGNPALMQALSALAGGIALLVTMSALLPLSTGRGLLLFLSVPVGIALHVLMQRGLRGFYLGKKPDMALAIGALVLLLLLGRFGGGFGTMLVSILLALFTAQQTLHGGKHTETGTQIISQALGFRRFLQQISITRINMMLREDPQYFYKMLPFAISIGCGGAFAERFSDVLLEPCDWYFEDEELPRNAGGFHLHMLETMEMLELSIRK